MLVQPPREFRDRVHTAQKPPRCEVEQVRMPSCDVKIPAVEGIGFKSSLRRRKEKDATIDVVDSDKLSLSREAAEADQHDFPPVLRGVGRPVGVNGDHAFRRQPEIPRKLLHS